MIFLFSSSSFFFFFLLLLLLLLLLSSSSSSTSSSSSSSSSSFFFFLLHVLSSAVRKEVPAVHVRKEAEPDGSGLTVDFHRSPQGTATLHQNRLPRQRYRDNATQTGASISACEMREKRQERRDIILILCEPQPCLQTTTGTLYYNFQTNWVSPKISKVIPLSCNC